MKIVVLFPPVAYTAASDKEIDVNIFVTGNTPCDKNTLRDVFTTLGWAPPCPVQVIQCPWSLPADSTRQTLADLAWISEFRVLQLQDTYANGDYWIGANTCPVEIHDGHYLATHVRVVSRNGLFGQAFDSVPIPWGKEKPHMNPLVEDIYTRLSFGFKTQRQALTNCLVSAFTGIERRMDMKVPA